MLGEGIVDDADFRFEVSNEGHRDGNVGMRVDEVGCAINRVNNEGRGRAQASRCRGLFTEEAMGNE